MERGLKLRAVDAEDMTIIAAFLQDAIVPIGDLCYQPEERRFFLVANRFKWEAGESGPIKPAAEPDADDAPYFERTHCGVCFDGVVAVKSRGLRRNERGRLLDLLTIRVEPAEPAAEAPATAWITLQFADDVCLRLEVDGWVCHVEDMGEPWPTRCRPCHPIDTGTSES
jgi:hypothetical protein